MTRYRIVQQTTDLHNAPKMTNRLLSITNLTTTGFDVTFAKAQDPDTDDTLLEYKLYSIVAGSVPEFQSISFIETNGTLEDSGTDVNSLSISGKSEGDDIAFAVIVNDPDGHKVAYISAEKEIPDLTPPVIGDASFIFNNATTTSFDVEVSPATDNITQQGSLLYDLYTSDSNNLDTDPATVMSNGTYQDSATGLSPSLSATGLSGTVYVNVIVSDGFGNASIYTQKSITISTEDTIAPTISNGTLTEANKTSNSVDITFNKATDDSPDTELIYRLWRAPEGTDLSTLNTINSNGTLIQFQQDVNSLTDASAPVDTISEYQVTVEDQAGNTSIYDGVSVTIGNPPITSYIETFPTDQSGWPSRWTPVNFVGSMEFNVVSGEAIISPTNIGDDGAADLKEVIVADSTVQFDFTISDVKDSVQPSFHFRTIGNWSNKNKNGYWLWYYQNTIYLGYTDSGVNHNLINAPKSLVSGTKYTCKLELNGSSIQIKIWEASQNEPVSYDISYNDFKFSSGGFSVKLTTGSTSNGTETISFDNFNIAPISDVPVINTINTIDGGLVVYYSEITSADSYEYRLDGGSPINIGTTNPYTINGLINGTSYTVEVRAIISGSPTNWSNAVSAIPSAGASSIDSISIDQNNFSIEPGGTYQLTVTLQTTGNPDISVTWSSSDSNVATVNSNGLVTGVSNGTAVITVTSNFDSQKSDTVIADIITITTTGSRSGDEAALEALYSAANGGSWTNKSGWASSGMSLSNSIYGVTTASIGGELRVTQIDLRYNNLTGSINFSELSNLTQMTLFAVYGNSLDCALPSELFNLLNLQYLYLCHGNSAGYSHTDFPHEIAQTGGGYFHPGKAKDEEWNHFTGAIPTPQNPAAMSLKWLVCNWTDTVAYTDSTAWGGDGLTSDWYSFPDGINYVPPELFDIQTFEGLQICSNMNVQTKIDWPAGIGNMSNLYQLTLTLGHAADHYSNPSYFLKGSINTNINNLTNLKYFDLGDHTQLSVNFNNVDIQNLTNLRGIGFTNFNFYGDLPAIITDGSTPDLDEISLTWPTGSGLSGNIQSGATNIIIFLINDNAIEGDIPAGFWNNKQLRNTDFSKNHITGFGTDDVTQLGSLYWKCKNFRFSYNWMKGRWPNWAWGTDRVSKLTRVHFDHNYFNFADRLWRPSSYNPNNKTILDLYWDNWQAKKDAGLVHEFRYGNQGPFGSAGDESGGVIDLSSSFSHANNQYQWYKDGSALSGETSVSIDTSGYGSGTYHLEVTNPGDPGTTLSSINFTI